MKVKTTGIISWFTQNSVAANLLMMCIIAAGIATAFTIKKEFFPEFSLGQISINVSYPGAAPAEVEEGIVIKIEDAIQDLEGIKTIESDAYEGFGSVSVQLKNGYTVQPVLDKIRSRVDGISSFPENAEKPVINERTSKQEVIWVLIAGEMDEHSIKTLSEEVRDDLMALSEISQAEIVGVRSAEIAIEVSEINLRQYGLTFDDVVRAIKTSSLDLPGGSVKTLSGEILLRTKGKAYQGKEFENIVLLAKKDGTRVTLKDIATVTDGFDEDENFFFKYQGKSAVGIKVFRVGNQSTLKVTKAARDYVEKKQSELPNGIRILSAGDSSVMLKDRIDLMLKNMFYGGLMVFISLFLFLRLRVAFWVMAGLPVCFLGTIWLMPTPLVDISINMITLFGFILVLGIVVDDAIVIGENIYTHVQKKGAGVENVIIGAKEVAMPATFGVLTTIAAFLPMLMIPGVNGKIWSGIGLVVILCLFFSLVESKLILPAHLSHMQIKSYDTKGFHPLDWIQNKVSGFLKAFIFRIYEPLLSVSLKNRYTTIAIFIAVLITTAGLYQSGVVRFVFFPEVEWDIIQADLTMYDGTPSSNTKNAAERIEKAAQIVSNQIQKESKNGINPFKHLLVVSYSDTGVFFYVELVPNEDRDLTSQEIIGLWRDKVGEIPGAKAFKFWGAEANTGDAIHFQFKSKNYDHLAKASAELKKKLAEYKGVYDIRDSFHMGQKEIKLNIQPTAQPLGLSLSDLAGQIRQGFYGTEVQKIQRGRDEVTVKVRYPRKERSTLSNLNNIRIRTIDGKEIPFASVATANIDQGFSQINRVDRNRVVSVIAATNKGQVEPQKVITDIQKTEIPRLLKKYPSLNYAISGEAKEQQEALAQLSNGLVFALFAIFAMMAIPLKSYAQPIIIMSAIPFGIVGAIFGHIITGQSVSILSLCGIIALSGVVVNDSLVMVDFINAKRRAGYHLQEAIKISGVARFRAIMLTSITTFFGLLPMLLEKSMQAQFLIPMATSLGFGVMFATVITLFLIPSLYLIGTDVKYLFVKIFSKFNNKKALIEHA